MIQTISSMFPHVTYMGCAPAHTACTEATCDNEKRASEYWEHLRLERIKNFGTAKGDDCALGYHGTITSTVHA